MSAVEPGWTFFSHYAHVLICLAENPRCRLRDVAEKIGVTERTAMRLIDQLDRAGVIRRTRQGRRNFYQIDTSGSLLHPIEANCSVEQLLEVALQPDTEEKEK
jgi:DNA-binding MarR family transcriptional regulator